MSTRSSSKPPPSRLTHSQLSEALYRTLKVALDRQCATRYNVGIELRCLETSSEGEVEVKLCVECNGLTQMPVRLSGIHVGGNVYEIVCCVEGGASHRFSYSLPVPTGAQLSCMSHVSEEVAAFLREELERRLGRLLLQRSGSSGPSVSPEA